MINGPKERVKILYDSDLDDLENKINSFIDELQNSRNTYTIIGIDHFNDKYSYATVIRYACLVKIANDPINLNKGDE